MMEIEFSNGEWVNIKEHKELCCLLMTGITTTGKWRVGGGGKPYCGCD